VELLVVIAIIAILVALLVPAVQKVRAEAQRSACVNNLRNVGLALHSHHDVRKALPPGSMQTGGIDSSCYTNWAIEILPYLEQQDLHAQYKQTQVNTSHSNNLVGQNRVAAFECPADSNIGRLDQPATGPGSSQLWMRGSYRGNAGRTNDIPPVFGFTALYQGFWDSYQPYFWPNGGRLTAAYRGPLHGTAVCYNGVAAPKYVDPRTGRSISEMGGPERFGAITDGLSNTFLVGEYTLSSEQSHGYYGTFWAYATGAYSLSSFSSPLQATFSSDVTGCHAKHAHECDDGAAEACRRGWGSNHPGGANFLMCDGSVRWAGYSTDIRILAALATIAGSEVGLLRD
jgi:prepilin-type processing-associated H-X9-DG protein